MSRPSFWWDYRRARELIAGSWWFADSPVKPTKKSGTKKRIAQVNSSDEEEEENAPSASASSSKSEYTFFRAHSHHLYASMLTILPLDRSLHHHLAKPTPSPSKPTTTHPFFSPKAVKVQKRPSFKSANGNPTKSSQDAAPPSKKKTKIEVEVESDEEMESKKGKGKGKLVSKKQKEREEEDELENASGSNRDEEEKDDGEEEDSEDEEEAEEVTKKVSLSFLSFT